MAYRVSVELRQRGEVRAWASPGPMDQLRRATRVPAVAEPFLTRADLRVDLERLGLRPGDAVLAHGALSKVGRLLNGPDAVIGALLDAVSPGGTVLAYTDWDARYDELLDADGRRDLSRVDLDVEVQPVLDRLLLRHRLERQRREAGWDDVGPPVGPVHRLAA